MEKLIFDDNDDIYEQGKKLEIFHEEISISFYMNFLISRCKII